MTNTVMNPVPMKDKVATNERTDKRLKPQMPWPLVQPAPQRVPKPTNKPATITMVQLASMRGACKTSAGKMSLATKGEVSKPSRKVKRHGESSGVGLNKPSKMPVMPRMRPLFKQRAGRNAQQNAAQ